MAPFHTPNPMPCSHVEIGKLVESWMVQSDWPALVLDGEEAVYLGGAIAKYVGFTIVHPKPSIEKYLYLLPAFAEHCAKGCSKTMSFNLYKTLLETGSITVSFHRRKLSHREMKDVTCAHGASK